MKTRLFIMSLASMFMMAACTTSSPATQGGPSFEEVLASRRSVRDYDASKSISKEEVTTLLLASQNAPSWANTQPSRYYVAMSEDKVAAVQKLIGERNAQNVQGAPVLIVSTFVKGQSGHFAGTPTNEIGDGWGAYDNGLANGYLVLQARAMGFDTLIMGMRDSDGLREIFNIPEEETVMAVISLGYRASDPATPGHKALDEIVKFF